MISSNNLTDTNRLFRRLALLTVLIIYLLILAGGIVRSTGSGMGCPDWPKCFGQWIPPTEVSQLPANYQEIYGHRGYANTTFNAAKTWIEYVNRLLGVLTGFFIFFTFVTSLRFLSKDRVITFFSFLAFVLVGLQGWLGSVVVKTELSPWIVTLHMILAIVIVGILLYVVARTYATIMPTVSIANKPLVNRLLVISTVLLLIQIVLGTQVRQLVDVVARQLGDDMRASWLTTIGFTFYVHRSFSLIVLGSQFLWIFQLTKNTPANWLTTLSRWVVASVAVNIITGVIMGYLAIPPFAQPVHLTVAIITLGIQFVVFLLVNKEQLIPRQSVTATKSVVRV